MPIALEGLLKEGAARVVGENARDESRLVRVDGRVLYEPGESMPSDLPEVYIAEMGQGESILLRRRRGGRSEVRLLANVGKRTMRLLGSVGFLNRYIEQRMVVTEACVQRGADPMHLGRFWPYAGVHQDLAIVRVPFGVDRKLNEQGEWEGTVRTVKPFANAWVRARLALIGHDCSASGTTLCVLIPHIKKEDARANEGKSALEEVLIIDACGSGHSVKRCHRVCLELGLRATFVMADAIIDVTKDKGFCGLPYTDLPILGDRTIASVRLSEAGRRVYFGAKICSMGNATARFYFPYLHILLTLADMMEAERDPKKERDSGEVWRPNPWSEEFQRWLASDAQREFLREAKVEKKDEDHEATLAKVVALTRRTLEYWDISVPEWARAA